jgi:hypothetical protein
MKEEEEIKIPDFYETNGKKICIEVANNYHHNEEWAKKRIEHFAKYGWKCLVFFADRKNRLELSKDEILKQIRGVLDD